MANLEYNFLLSIILAVFVFFYNYLFNTTAIIALQKAIGVFIIFFVSLLILQLLIDKISLLLRYSGTRKDNKIDMELRYTEEILKEYKEQFSEEMESPKETKEKTALENISQEQLQSLISSIEE